MKGSGFCSGFIVNFAGSRTPLSVAKLSRSKAAERFFIRKEEGMKYVINGYQTIYDNGSRDKIKLTTPIYSDDIEAVRTKLKKKHSGIGKKCVGVNLDYTEINDKV